MTRVLNQSDVLLIRSDENEEHFFRGSTQTPPPAGADPATNRAGRTWGADRDLQTLRPAQLSLRRRAWARAQGCSTLFVVVHIAQGFEASEGSGVAILGDGIGLIEPQDIISKAAQSGEDARVAAYARSIFAEGDVAGVVLFVFDAPMFANGIGGLAGTDGAIGKVERGFA